MAQFDITQEAIAASIADDQRRLSAVKYRDAFRNGWDGQGTAPQWVVNAISAGQSLEHFLVRSVANVQTRKGAGVDWRDDPFTGSRLATIKPEPRQAS